MILTAMLEVLKKELMKRKFLQESLEKFENLNVTEKVISESDAFRGMNGCRISETIEQEDNMEAVSRRTVLDGIELFYKSIHVKDKEGLIASLDLGYENHEPTYYKLSSDEATVERTKYLGYDDVTYASANGIPYRGKKRNPAKDVIKTESFDKDGHQFCLETPLVDEKGNVIGQHKETQLEYVPGTPVGESKEIIERTYQGKDGKDIVYKSEITTLANGNKIRKDYENGEMFMQAFMVEDDRITIHNYNKGKPVNSIFMEYNGEEYTHSKTQYFDKDGFKVSQEAIDNMDDTEREEEGIFDIYEEDNWSPDRFSNLNEGHRNSFMSSELKEYFENNRYVKYSDRNQVRNILGLEAINKAKENAQTKNKNLHRKPNLGEEID